MLLESRLAAACRAPGNEPSPCFDAALEHFAAGGGRIRARICFDAGIRLGLVEHEALLAATLCELLHNASLVQDDLLDRTTIRRGAPTICARYGDTVAVCTGDLMLSAAYGILADLSSTALTGEALRLVHRRASEVIGGQATEYVRGHGTNETTTAYERHAQGKSASLISLSLELPLLLSGYSEFLSTAHSAACHFAVAYQIADDIDDYEQDRQEGSSNLLLLLQRCDEMTFTHAREKAIELAGIRLASAEEQSKLLPCRCAGTLLEHAERLRQSLACLPTYSTAQAGD